MAAPRPASPKPPERPRAATRQHGDVLVLGASLEAAVAAVKLLRDGWKVLWVGDVPGSTTKAGDFLVPATPFLAPAPANAPALSKLLADCGAEGDARRTWRPITLQILGDRRREDLAPAVVASLAEPALALNTLAAEALSVGYLGRRRTAARTAALGRVSEAASAEAREIVGGLDAVLGEVPENALEPVRIAAAPHQVQGGIPALVKLLHERFAELGGWTFPLPRPLEAFELDLSGVRCVLPGGDAHSARLALVGVDESQLASVLPENERVLTPRLHAADVTPLLRMSLVVRSRGLPPPFGPAALLDGRWLLERSVVEPGKECVNVFWRRGERTAKEEADEVVARLRTMLPFYEKHLLLRSEPAPVPYFGRTRDRRTRPRWKALQALGPQAGLGGFEGGARLGLALAARARQLAPRKDVLAQERER